MKYGEKLFYSFQKFDPLINEKNIGFQEYMYKNVLSTPIIKIADFKYY